MPYHPISLREANHNFSRLIAAVERGEAFCITRRGQEVARLTPSPAPIPDHVIQGQGAGVHPAFKPSAEISPQDTSLGERVRQLEARLAELSAVLTE
jgi:prevent-host-death family protein